jgi:hypothetical protein
MWTQRLPFSASWRKVSSPPNRVAPFRLRPGEKWLPLKRRDGQKQKTDRPQLAAQEVPERRNTSPKRPAGRLLPLNVRGGQKLNQSKRQLDLFVKCQIEKPAPRSPIAPSAILDLNSSFL